MNRYSNGDRKEARGTLQMAHRDRALMYDLIGKVITIVLFRKKKEAVCMEAIIEAGSFEVNQWAWVSTGEVCPWRSGWSEGVKAKVIGGSNRL